MVTMFDSINVNELSWAVTNHQPDALAGYVGGHWPTYADLVTKFPKTQLLSIAVNASEDADCLDVESGDATIADVYAWFQRQLKRKVWKPVIYTSAGNLRHLLATMQANGIKRSAYRVWSAHYTDPAHICGPKTCLYPQADGTQWTSRAFGHSLDQSLLSDGFFAPAKTPAAPTAASPVRHEVVSAKGMSLEGLARSRNTTVAHMQSLSLANMTPANQAVWNAYIALDNALHAAGKPRPELPVGFVYYTSQ